MEKVIPRYSKFDEIFFRFKEVMESMRGHKIRSVYGVGESDDIAILFDDGKSYIVGMDYVWELGR